MTYNFASPYTVPQNPSKPWTSSACSCQSWLLPARHRRRFWCQFSGRAPQMRVPGFGVQFSPRQAGLLLPLPVLLIYCYCCYCYHHYCKLQLLPLLLLPLRSLTTTPTYSYLPLLRRVLNRKQHPHAHQPASTLPPFRLIDLFFAS